MTFNAQSASVDISGIALMTVSRNCTGIFMALYFTWVQGNASISIRSYIG